MQHCILDNAVVVSSDLNECLLGIANCDINSLCRNTDGSFTCECLRGYIGDGNTCDYVHDPCGPLGQNHCDQNANCTETPTAYTCTCHDGYVGNGFECISK